jgi:hypothetical protein
MPTNESIIETPLGTRVGTINEKLEVLGIAAYTTQTGNQPDEQTQWYERVEINVPVGTMAIVASIDYWMLGYGSFTPELHTIEDTTDETGVWHTADHHFGVGRISVFAADINTPDLTKNPATQTASIHVGMNLFDDNFDDSWFGLVRYTLLFLGQASRKIVLPKVTGEHKSRLVFSPRFSKKRKDELKKEE